LLPADSQPLRRFEAVLYPSRTPGQVCRLAVDHDTATRAPPRASWSWPPGVLARTVPRQAKTRPARSYQSYLLLKKSRQ